MSAVGGLWPKQAGQRIARCRGGGEPFGFWSWLRSIEERMGGWVGITELQLGLAGGGLRGMRSSGCLLRLEVVTRRQLKTYH